MKRHWSRFLGIGKRVQDERGAVVPLVALMMIVVLAVTAIAVDIGVQRAAARDMQAVADAVALDTARRLPTCDVATLSSAANQSLARQGHTIGQDSPLVVTPGHLDPITKKFVAGSAAGTCNAVRIQAATTVNFSFAPVIGSDSGTATRSAVGASADPVMCFSAGTRALSLSSSGSALGPVLDRLLKVNLGVAGYSGLVDLQNLSIPLAALDTQLRAGTTHGVLDTTTVQLRQLMIAQAAVLRNQSPPSIAQATLLESVAAQVATTFAVKWADILKVDNASGAALSATVNALDLLSAAVVAANGTNAIQINQSLTIPLGLSSTSVSLSVIHPPQIACGPVGTTAKTASVRVDLQSGINLLGLLGTGTTSLGVLVGQGTATLTGVACTASGPSATIDGTTSTADLVGRGGSGNPTLAQISLLGLELLKVNLLSVSLASGGGSHQFLYPASSGLPSQPTYTYGGALGLTLSAPPGSLLTNTAASLTNLVGSTGVTSILTQTLGLLGIKLGTMDVTVLGRPSCDGSRLAG